MTRDEAMRKVASLLRLAERGGTPAEAATAAAHAQALMEREGIEATALQLDSGAPVEAEPVRDFGDVPEGSLGETGRARWRATLAVHVCRANGCTAYTSHRGGKKTVEVVGRPGNVQTVRYLYAWLTRETERLIDSHGRGLGVTWRSNFAQGVVQTVAERLRAQHEETLREVRAEAKAQDNGPLFAVNPHALALVERAIALRAGEAEEVHRWAKEKLHLVTRSSSAGRFNGTAREAGRQAGRSVNMGGSAGALGSARRQIGGRS